ncbi:hypothetical protein OG883_44130 [Streptomyces sp. NBC_01142]|uniref:hypothetical protein n=1 Tax=Streptomyces sp. NBC_01142 TaxID=2975865 RepID=UPI002251D6A4|nr:hypothetical protein [Streptomyces sp. NBC_01142]MCX4826632.1 hypothetical protein [Streptomyces sp. NBC_01142]
MPIPRLSPGDRVRVTVSATVERSGPGCLELSPRTYIEFESEDDLDVEIIVGLFRCGDVVTDGSRTLMRTVIVRDSGTEAYWAAADGSIVRDDEVRPEALRLLLRVA